MLNTDLIGHISEHDLQSFWFAAGVFLIATISIVVFVAWLVTNGFRPRQKEVEQKRDDEKQDIEP